MSKAPKTSVYPFNSRGPYEMSSPQSLLDRFIMQIGVGLGVRLTKLDYRSELKNSVYFKFYAVR